jgi:beta-N-acetylglucosaminidase
MAKKVKKANSAKLGLALAGVGLVGLATVLTADIAIRRAKINDIERKNAQKEQVSDKEAEQAKKDIERYEIETLEWKKRSEKEQDYKTNEGSISYDTNCLMDNTFFENTDYLTQAEISDFLNKKRSCLRKTGIEKIIMDASKKYKINPLLLLARTQVEKGLVTKEKTTKAELDYATGYGAFDKGNWLKSEGLESQIVNTARILRKRYDEFDKQIIDIDYGKKVVSPTNNATYALLRYTPHTSGAILNSKVLKKFSKEIKRKQ